MVEDSQVLGLLAGGFVASGQPDELPEALRGEGTLMIARWVLEDPGAYELTVELAQAFEAYASQHLAAIGWETLRSELQTMLFMRDAGRAPHLFTLLSAGLGRVDSAGQLAGFLRFMKRLISLMALGVGKR